MPERKSPFYLLTGLLFGLILGVVYAWVLTPQEALETQPSMLRSDFKDTYREMIARAYLYSNDLGRAKARLALLDDEDPVRELAVQAQLSLGQDAENRPAHALAALAAALQEESEGTPMASVEGTLLMDITREADSGETTPEPTEGGATPVEPADTQNTPAPTRDAGTDNTPEPTTTPTATATPTATLGAPFILNDMQLECNPAIDPPKIQIYVFDAAGEPVPGVAALVFWEGQVDRFVTGLKPTFGLGYADFEMDPLKTYTLRLENGGDPIQSITGRLCEDGGESYYGSWRFNFVQP
ncbi:MAG: hypothetical protein JW757_08420 [Anaerolineales bacterium]|nr:hypothetical protein [Anaerolineales bacterium]